MPERYDNNNQTFDAAKTSMLKYRVHPQRGNRGLFRPFGFFLIKMYENSLKEALMVQTNNILSEIIRKPSILLQSDKFCLQICGHARLVSTAHKL